MKQAQTQQHNGGAHNACASRIQAISPITAYAARLAIRANQITALVVYEPGAHQLPASAHPPRPNAA